MSIRAKMYANKQGKADGAKNKIQIAMDITEAEAFTSGDKEVSKAVREEVKKTLAGSRDV